MSGKIIYHSDVASPEKSELPIKPEPGMIVYDRNSGWIMQYSDTKWDIMGEFEMLRGAVIDIEEERLAIHRRT